VATANWCRSPTRCGVAPTTPSPASSSTGCSPSPARLGRDADCDDDEEDYDEEVRTDSWRPWRRYRVNEPPPDGLPAEIDPDTADELYCWLEPALDRAHELLALLRRRAAEDWPDDEAQTTPSCRLCGP